MRAHPIWQGLAMAVVIGVAEASAQVPATAQTPERGEHGSSIFRTYCASCHGETGRGDGPLAQSLRRPPPDLTGIAARHQGVFPTEKVYRIIDGRERVPAMAVPICRCGVMHSCDLGRPPRENPSTRRFDDWWSSWTLSSGE